MSETLQPVINTFRERISPRNFLGPRAHDPSPEFTRFTDKIEMKLLPGTKIDAPFIKKYFKGVIDVAGMQAFTDPIILSPDHPNSKMIVAKGYANPPIPFHSQGIQYVTAPVGEGIPPSPITAANQPVTHSNVSFYYFPDNGLVTVLVDTCKESNRQQILDYTYDFVNPDTMRDMLTHSKNEGGKWKEYKRLDKKDLHPERKYLNPLMDILNYKSLTERKDVLVRGAALEKIVLDAKSECNGRLLASLTPAEQKRSQDLYEEYELILERDYAHGILDGSIPIDQPFIFHDRYMQINTKEAEALNIQPGQTVGMIGAGYNGETAFNIVDITGAHVIAYEMDSERADILRQLIKKKGYAQEITVIAGKVGEVAGEPFHSYGYDVYSSLRDCDGGYIIAALARGKPYIYDDLMGASYKYECTVVRTTEDDYGLLYRPTNTNLFNTDYYQLESKEKYVNDDPNGILSFSLVQRILNSPLYSIIHEPEEWKEE